MLDHGLTMLQEFKCPVVLGDFPDASAAIGTMLHPGQMPAGITLEKANRRLRDWAAVRPHVSIVPLAAFMKAAQTNTSYQVHTHKWPAGQTRALLQEDAMHPDCPGCAALTLCIFEALHGKQGRFPRENVIWDPEKIMKLAGH